MILAQCHQMSASISAIHQVLVILDTFPDKILQHFQQKVCTMGVMGVQQNKHLRYNVYYKVVHTWFLHFMANLVKFCLKMLFFVIILLLID